uniref:Uncharacterized protein n=1 Tax=Romanomermis culicivorax TaxID=13658 RepID=A0A915IV79_ROMCU
MTNFRTVIKRFGDTEDFLRMQCPKKPQKSKPYYETFMTASDRLGASSINKKLFAHQLLTY